MKRSNIKDKIEGNEIDLSLNELSEIPVQELADAPKATHLDLSCNKISKLPVFMADKNLHHSADMKVAPKILDQLLLKAKQWNDNFATLTHLVKIDLSKNLLRELPGNFGNLLNLRELDLYGNQLNILPVSFCRLKNLKWLDLKNNPLDPKLQAVAGDCLDREQCRKCAMDVVTFMQSVESDIERQKQKKLKLEREKEAARKAKEEKELEAQRKVKKAERERRKAEAKARKEKMDKQEKGHGENQKNMSNDYNSKNSLKQDKRSKSGFSTCATFLFVLITAPILLMLSMVCYRMFNEQRDMSIDHFLETFEETKLELKKTILVWWHAFARPYLSSLQMSIQDWMKFFT